MMGKLNGCIFLLEDDELLEKYHTIWDKVSADIIREFGNEPVYNKESLKTKIKSHGDEVRVFHDKKIPEKGKRWTLKEKRWTLIILV